MIASIYAQSPTPTIRSLSGGAVVFLDFGGGLHVTMPRAEAQQLRHALDAFLRQPLELEEVER